MERVYVYVNDHNNAEAYIEPKAEIITEYSQNNQDECNETYTSTCESEKATPYRGSCQKCNQRFSNLFQFKYHMKTMHDEEEPPRLNKCTICLYEFVNISALISHMRLHTGEKPFACETCGKKFAFKVALVKHYCIDGNQPYMKKVTTTEKPKVCNVCHAEFKTNATLAKHKRKHKKPFSCNMCHKKYRFKTALDSHVCINRARPYMIKTENSEVETTMEPIDNKETVKAEKIKSETDIEVREMIEIKLERDELDSGDIGMAEIKIEEIKTDIKEEY